MAVIWDCCYRICKIKINTLRPTQNGRHFADDIFKCIFLNENVWISIKISLKFVPKGPINKIPALVQIMAWRRPVDKPLFEAMMVNLPTHICVTRPLWVKQFYYSDAIMSAMASQITGVSVVCSTGCSGPGQRKHQSSASLTFVRWDPAVTGGFPSQRASNAENVSILRSHHVIWIHLCSLQNSIVECISWTPNNLHLHNNSVTICGTCRSKKAS